MGLMEGKVVLISGAARGQGRAHAVTMAREGADVVIFDICAPIESSSVPLGSAEELEETKAQVEALGRRCVAMTADARSTADVDAVVAAGVEQLGKIDAAAINHGIVTYAGLMEHTDQQFRDQLEVNLFGPFVVARSVARHMIDRGGGGSIVITSSGAGLVVFPDMAGYNAAKHGVIGLAKAIALELAPHEIRCNAICPGAVNTIMIHDPSSYARITGRDDATWEDVAPLLRQFNHKLPIDQIEPEDVSQAVLYFVSDMGRHVTGTALPVDAGAVMK